MKGQQILLSAATFAVALANEHFDRDREREGDFRALDEGRSSWWVWGIAGLIFVFCIVFACALYFLDCSADDDDEYHHHPRGATAYARAETTRPFPTMPAKKKHHKHHKHHTSHRTSGDSSFLVPMFSNMISRDPAIAV
jgi:hypothetical protein